MSNFKSTSGPAYSFGTRHDCERPRQKAQPELYDVSSITRFGKTSNTSCVLGGRLQHGSWYPHNKVESPGPGSYRPEFYGSIQWKCSSNHLNPPAAKTNAKIERAWSGTPGPGAYDITPLDTYKTRTPGVKLRPNTGSSQK